MTPATPAGSAEIRIWERRLLEVAGAWTSVLTMSRTRSAAIVPSWEPRFAQARTHQAKLVDAGLWRGGPRTLLAALDLHFRELALTAGLAWLLSPDGHHGLGVSLLDAMLDRLGITDRDTSSRVRIQVEETRADTRADLVIYGPTWTLVVEAKVFALEQPEQLDRLYDHWANEPGARFVFLTARTRLPVTNVRSRSAWSALTWADVARALEHIVRDRSQITPGVLEYLATLEAYHRV